MTLYIFEHYNRDILLNYHNDNKKYHDRAKNKYNEIKKVLDKKRENVNKSFEKLGILQTKIVKNELRAYMDFIDKLSMQDILDTEAPKMLRNIRQSITIIETSIGNIISGTMLNVMTYFGAFGTVGLLANTSKEIIKYTLSGVKPTNATLEWFGSDGLGKDRYKVILGDEAKTKIPLAIITDNLSKPELDTKYYDNIESLCEIIEAEGIIWEKIDNKVNAKYKLLNDMIDSLKQLLNKIEIVEEALGTLVGKWSEKQQKDFEALLQQTNKITTYLHDPIMHDEDLITKDLMQYQKKYNELVEQLKKEE